MGKRIVESQPIVTKHASHRMSERSIKDWQVEQVLTYGRKAYCNKAVIYAVGRKEVQANGRFLEPCEGIHVLCSLNDGAVTAVSGVRT